MPITVTCDECSEIHRVRDEAAGKRLKCKGCGKSLKVEALTPREDAIPDDALPGWNLGLLIGLSIGGIGLATALAAWMLLPVKPTDNVADKRNDTAISEPTPPTRSTPLTGNVAASQDQIQQSRDKLKAIGQALGKNLPNDFTKKAYPAGYSDQEGKLILSWRVAILPALGEHELFAQFRLDEPWDSDHNSQLIPKMPAVFKPVRGESKEGYTYYRGFAGAEAMFPLKSPTVEKVQLGDRWFYPVSCRAFGKITDGTSNTFLIAEAAESIPWTKPEELICDAKQPLPKLGGQFDGDFLVLLADGAAMNFSRTVSEDARRTAINPADGVQLSFKGGDGSGFLVEVVTPATADRKYALSRLAAASPHGTASQIKDDANETAFAGMVSAERAVPWTKPDDLVLDDTFQSNEPPQDLSKANAFAAGAIMFSNGSIRHVHLQQGMDTKMFGALFTIAGGEPSPLSKLYPPNFKTIQPTYATPQEHVRHAEARTANKNSLKSIALAFLNYEQTFRHFPPATVYGPDGKPWHSWRVVILPFLGHGDLYEKYDASVPWDHPNNAAVLEQMPQVYRDPLSDKPNGNKTPYLVVTGPGTAFPTKASGSGGVAQVVATPEKPESTPRQPVANDRRQQTGPLPLGADTSQPAFLTPERRKQNLLADGSFEDGSASKWKLNSFRSNKLSGALEGGDVKDGKHAAALRTTITDDTHFDQTVTIKPGTRYLLSGWIKTKDVAIEKVDQTYGKAGATLSIWGGYEHSRSLTGTNDWTYVTLMFDARDRSEVTVCARLGYWFSVAAGEAWFDDLNLIAIGESPVSPTAPAPSATITTNKEWKGWQKEAPPPAIAPFNAEQAKQHQEAWAKHLDVPVEYTNSIGMKFRLIPPGDYLRGCRPEEISTGVNATEPYWGQFLRSSGPQHKVIVTQPLYLGVYEVTQESYSQVMGNNPAHFAPTGAGRGLIAGKETGKFPVERVSWNDSVDFCVKLSEREQLKPCYSRTGEAVTLRIGNGYRLPTEAEWEFACRAGTTTTFWNGNSVEDYAQVGRHYLKKEQGRTHEVGELKSNPFGLFDIHGNVWEYAQDGWSSTTYGQFANSPAIDPSFPPSGSGMRPIRGGSWMDVPTTSTSGSRLANGPTNRDFINVGFRASLSVEAVKATLASPARAAAPPKNDDDQAVLTLKSETRGFTSVAFSPDGKRLVTGSIERAVKVWDIAGGREQFTVAGGFCAVFSPSGKLLASAGPENAVNLWDAATGRETLTLKGHTGDVRSVAFSADGKRVASASADHSVKLWDAQSYRDKQLKSVAFNHDGSRIATAADSGSIKIWDAKTGQKLHELSGHGKDARGADFSPDGKWVATGGGDSLVKLWTLEGQPKAASDGTIVKALVDPQKRKSEWEALQGTWRLTNGADFANQLPPEVDIKDSHLVIRGETATVHIKNHVMGCLLTIDPTQTPRAFDMTFAEDIFGDSLSMGIYSLNRDALQIAWQPPADGRPKEFSTASPQAKDSPNQPHPRGGPPVMKFERVREPLARMDTVFDLAGWQKTSRELNKLRVRVQLGRLEPLDLDDSAGPGYVGIVDLPVSETDGTVPADVWKVAVSVNFLVCNVTGLTDATLRQLTTHPGLYGLVVNGKSAATKVGLALLESCPHFGGVTLIDVPQTVELLTTLAVSSDLRIIEIIGPPPSPELLTAIACFKSVESLQLRVADLTDDTLIELAKLQNLKKLSLPKAGDFKFDKPTVTDKGLAAVKSMKKLKRLEMFGHGIDNLKLNEINEHLRTRK